MNFSRNELIALLGSLDLAKQNYGENTATYLSIELEELCQLMNKLREQIDAEDSAR